MLVEQQRYERALGRTAARLFFARIQLVERALQFFKLLSSLAELAFRCQTLVVGKVFGGFGAPLSRSRVKTRLQRLRLVSCMKALAAQLGVSGKSNFSLSAKRPRAMSGRWRRARRYRCLLPRQLRLSYRRVRHVRTGIHRSRWRSGLQPSRRSP